MLDQKLRKIIWIKSSILKGINYRGLRKGVKIDNFHTSKHGNNSFGNINKRTVSHMTWHIPVRLYYFARHGFDRSNFNSENFVMSLPQMP